MNSKYPVHIVMFELVTSNRDVMLSCLRLYMKVYIICQEEGGYWKTRRRSIGNVVNQLLD